MGLVLDSSVLIAAERGRFDLKAFIEGEAAMKPIYIAMVSVSELLHGVHRAKPEHRSKRESFVEWVIRETPVLPFDLDCARRHAELWAKLEVAGERIRAHDMLIAATCLACGQSLATLNEKGFDRVDGLVLVETEAYVR